MLPEELLRLSVSKSKTFLDCKKKYQFTYIHKLPKKDQPFHIFGKFCHRVLEEFHNAYIKRESVLPYHLEMGNAFKTSWGEFQNSMTPEMKKECWSIIDKYLQIVSNDKKNNISANVLACEKDFSVNIDNKVLLNGMIDRIQLDDDGVIHVADYKTTKDKRYLKNDWFQLLTYAYVILSDNPDISKVRTSYILLRHDFEYLTKEFSVSEILTIRDKFLNYADQIQKEKEFSPNPTYLCKWCDFNNVCPQSFKAPTFGEIDF